MEVIPISHQLVGKFRGHKVEYEWLVGAPPDDAKKKRIILNVGYLERIYPQGLKRFVESGHAIFPISQFGIVVGPLLNESDRTALFLKDMNSLLLKHGFLRMYSWDCDDLEKRQLIYAAERGAALHTTVKRGLDFFVVE